MAQTPQPPEHLERLKTNLKNFINKFYAKKEISANTDLNSLIEVGSYYCPTNATASTLSNSPTSYAFSMLVEYNGAYGNGVKQTLTRYNSAQITWQRTLYTDNGTFNTSGWGKVYEDTGWKDVSFPSGFGHHSESDRVRYRRVGRVVELRGAVKNTNQISANTETTIATISDTTCRPSKRVIYRQQGSGINTYLIVINTDGTIAISRYGTTSYIAIPSSSWLNVHTTFLVD